MTWLSILAGIGIALGSPLVYLDQYVTILRTKTSQGFSHAICLVLLIANITRLFYWLAERFDTALLIQSILMIVAQIGLLKICLKYSNHSIYPLTGTSGSPDPTLFDAEDLQDLPHPSESTSPLTFSFTDSVSQSAPQQQSPRIITSHTAPPGWKNPSFDSYIDFFALLFAVEAALFILLQRYDWFIQAIGFVSLGLESTLPIPQLITNFRRKSLAGLSPMVLIGWLFGDTFKSIYLVLITPDSNSIQFKICALFQLSIDLLILTQALIYRRQTKLDSIELGRSASGSSSNPSQDTTNFDHPQSQLTIDDSVYGHSTPV